MKVVSRKSVCRFMICSFIAFINAVCTQAVINHACFGWDYLQRGSWILMFLSGFAVSLIFTGLLDCLSVKQDFLLKSPKWLYILPVMFFLCWLPYLMTYNPGLVNYDTVNQVLDFMDGVSAVPFGYVGGQEEVVVLYNAHHPVFVTLIFGTFIKIGVILGNPSVGLFMYIIVQMILAAIIFSFAIKYSSELVGNSESVSIALVAFFALCPVIPYYVCIMLKNSLHSLLSVLFVLVYLRMTLKPEALSVKEKLLWCITSILLPLTQNTGIYLVILTSIPLVIKNVANSRKFLSCTLAAVVLMMLFITKVLYPVCNIFPGGKQEMLGTLFQQTGRYVRDYGDEVTQSEIEAISAVVDYDVLKNNFTFDTTDTIKATYNLHASKQELINYLMVWFKQGLKHPDAYFRGILPICGQFFAMGYDVGIFDHIPTAEGIWTQIKHVKPDEERSVVTDWYYWIRSFPLISLLFQHALYVLWIPMYAIYRKLISGEKSLLFIVPFVVNILFVVVSPMGYSRYALSLIFTSPILLYIVLKMKLFTISD